MYCRAFALDTYSSFNAILYSHHSNTFFFGSSGNGTVDLQWGSIGREFETNLPLTEPSANWGGSLPHTTGSIDYRTTLLRYPIIQNKTHSTALSWLLSSFASAPTLWSHWHLVVTRILNIGVTGGHDHTFRTNVLTQSIMIWYQDNMTTKGSWHTRYFFSYFSSKWQFTAGDFITLPTTIFLTSGNILHS